VGQLKAGDKKDTLLHCRQRFEDIKNCNQKPQGEEEQPIQRRKRNNDLQSTTQKTKD
jgi:hypothetical protein